MPSNYDRAPKGTGGRIISALTGFSPLLAAVVALAGCSTNSICPGGSYMQGDQCVLIAQDAMFPNFDVNVENNLSDISTENDDSVASEAADANEINNSESEQETSTTSDTKQRENNAEPEDPSLPPDGTAANDNKSAATADGRAIPSENDGSQSG